MKERDEDPTTEDPEPERLADRAVRVLRDRSNLKAPERFKDYCVLAVEGEQLEPTSFKEAVACLEKDLWKEAMDKEINSLKENGT